MITVSLPDSPLRLVPGAVWRFVVPTWLSCGMVSPFSPGGFWRAVANEIDRDLSVPIRILLLPDLVEYNVLYSNSTRDRGSLHSPDL